MQIDDMVVADTTKVRIFKQITTKVLCVGYSRRLLLILQRYEFSSKSQHLMIPIRKLIVVADTTKVRIFKQITTADGRHSTLNLLLLILQRYEFSSKSQHYWSIFRLRAVVADTTKVRIFKQITTAVQEVALTNLLLLILQRYEFSSKSQQDVVSSYSPNSCC